jgi:hypothetical protein
VYINTTYTTTTATTTTLSSVCIWKRKNQKFVSYILSQIGMKFTCVPAISKSSFRKEGDRRGRKEKKLVVVPQKKRKKKENNKQQS